MKTPFPSIETLVLSAAHDDARAIDLAADYLKGGEIVGLPTETVYGLAGHALQPRAVAKIFEIKERPYFDPLIIHIAESEWLSWLTKPDPEDAAIRGELLKRFWPGPLTLLFRKSEVVPGLVTAGHDSVAIRCPRHPVFSRVLRALGSPLAAPSANRFGRISPTRAEHVRDELNGRIPLILDAGPTPVGIESTIVRLAQDRIEILRPGPISSEELSAFGSVREQERGHEILVPGQTAGHYAPRTKMTWFDESELPRQPSGLVCWGPPHHLEYFDVVVSFSENQDLAEAAARLFGIMRELDHAGLERIFVQPVPDKGIGRAIMDRLRRAIAAHSPTNLQT